jgi:hypothetical protein
MTVVEQTTSPALPTPPQHLSDLGVAIWVQLQQSAQAADALALTLLKHCVASSDDAGARRTLEAYQSALLAQAQIAAPSDAYAEAAARTKVSAFIREQVFADGELAAAVVRKLSSGEASSRMLRAVAVLWVPEPVIESVNSYVFLQSLLDDNDGEHRGSEQDAMFSLVLKVIDDRLKEKDFVGGTEHLTAWMVHPKTHRTVLKKLWNAYLANGEALMLSLARIAMIIRPDKFPKLLSGCAEVLGKNARAVAIINYYLEQIEAHLRDQRWYNALGEAGERVKVEMSVDESLDFVTIAVTIPPASLTVGIDAASAQIVGEIDGERHSDFRKTAVRLILTAVDDVGTVTSCWRGFWQSGAKESVWIKDGQDWPAVE